MMATCLILHNMCVSDRVMGSIDLDYKASKVAEKETPSDTVDDERLLRLAPARLPAAVVNTDLRIEKQEWKQLKDPVEWARLQRALINFKGTL